MKRTIVILPFVIGLLGLTVGCDQRAERWLDMAEACMETNSDSAYRCLSQMDVMEGLSDRQQARYALLRTQAMHKCRIPLGSDSLINVAVEYYANGRDRHRLALSLLYKGLVHKQQYQVEQAVEAFVASEQAFEGVDDNRYKALLFNHYGGLLMNQNMYEEALKYYKETYRYEQLGDSIHYLISTCSQIANVNEIMGEIDSAKVYYERGLSYGDKVNDGKRKNYYLLLQNYATFLTKQGNYADAERLLLQCSEKIANTAYRYSLYSALTTLYYEKGVLEKALAYGRLIGGSDDSLTVCGGYLRLYKVYKAMGQMDSALYYHNLYRQYDSDIVMRQKTAEVAAIPYRVKSERLAEENDALTGWRLWLTVGIVGVALAAGVIYARIRRRHTLEQAEKERELAESQTSLLETQTSLADTQDLLFKTKVNLGQMRGALTHQSMVFSRMKSSLEEMKKKHQEDIKHLKEDIKQLEADIRKLKTNDHDRICTEQELKRNVKMLGKQLKIQTDKLQEAEHQRGIDQRIEYFMLCGQSSIAVDLLLQLRRGESGVSRFDIKPSEYLPLLMELLEQENPALHERLANSGLERKKLTMCYLMALGLDDVEMMSRAACLAPNSVKAYRKECREALCAFNG